MEFILVKDLLSDHAVPLPLELLAGESGLGNSIRSPRIQKYGLALAGYTEYLHPDRVQILGKTELSYLASLHEERQEEVLRKYFSFPICCFLVTQDQDVSPRLKELAEERKIPLLKSSWPSSVCITRLEDYLEDRLAPEVSLHGVLVDVYGVGCLILGKSGIGKSESALHLVAQGHRLVSDDVVEIRLMGRRLLGSGAELLRHHMEIRGLGIINVRDLFGVGAIRSTQSIDLVIQLEEWDSAHHHDRLGLDEESYDILGIPVPSIQIPVRPGRNITTIIEVAARNQLLKEMGYFPAHEFDQKVSEQLLSADRFPPHEDMRPE
ncbi:MAG: HPr(Ser) kinase/phosphatase [Candidatus Binatia bacterium]